MIDVVAGNQGVDASATLNMDRGSGRHLQRETRIAATKGHGQRVCGSRKRQRRHLRRRGDIEEVGVFVGERHLPGRSIGQSPFAVDLAPEDGHVGHRRGRYHGLKAGECDGGAVDGGGLKAASRSRIDDGVAVILVTLHEQACLARRRTSERAGEASASLDEERVAARGFAGDIFEALERQHRVLLVADGALVEAGETPDWIAGRPSQGDACRPGQRVAGVFSGLHGGVVERTLGNSRGHGRAEIDGDGGRVLRIVEGVLAFLTINGAADGSAVGKREHVLAARAYEILDRRKPDMAEQRALVELSDGPGVVGRLARHRIASRAAIDREIAVRESRLHHGGSDYHGIVAASHAQADLGALGLRHGHLAEGGDLVGAQDVDGPDSRARLQANGVVRRGGDHG